MIWLLLTLAALSAVTYGVIRYRTASRKVDVFLASLRDKPTN